MKKGIQLLSTLLCLIICLFSFAGCYKAELKFLIKNMDKFAKECEEYGLFVSDVEINSLECAYEGTHYKESGDLNLKGETLSVKYNEDDKDYKIEYAGIERTLSDSYIKLKSDTYRNIHRLWNDYNNSKKIEQEPSESRIVGIRIYDDNLFVLTNGIENVSLVKKVRGYIPLLLFKYDILTEEFSYCGYHFSEEKTKEYIYIIKNK